MSADRIEAGQVRAHGPHRFHVVGPHPVRPGWWVTYVPDFGCDVASEEYLSRHTVLVEAPLPVIQAPTRWVTADGFLAQNYTGGKAPAKVTIGLSEDGQSYTITTERLL